MTIYKTVKVRELYSDSQVAEFEALLNEQANSGWELHSLIPQADKDTIYTNIAIFVKKSED